MTAIGVLVPHFEGPLEPPEARPIGRAALLLEDEGQAVVFGAHADDGCLVGHRAVPGGWQAVRQPIRFAYDRYPSQTDPEGYAALRAGLTGVSIANPLAMTLLCRDKVRTQRVLEQHGLPQPSIETDPTRFQDRLHQWGTAYLKPRFGAFGRGISRVVWGDATPAQGEGAVAGHVEELFLQQAIPPLSPWKGVACRVLAQRTGPSTWWVGPPVVRRSASDWVVNAARGAEVVPAQEVLPALVDQLADLAERAARALADCPEGNLLVEIGLDAVVSHDQTPVIVEVNSRPRGRLEALAQLDPEQYQQAHVTACCRPLRYLATLID